MAGPRSRPGRMPAAKYVFGTPEEIANRSSAVAGPGLYTEFLPDTTAPHFEQIKPQSGSGVSVNRAPTKKVSGNIKFAGGPGVPGA